MTDTIEIETLDSKGLSQAYKGSYYFIAGAGGDLQEWVNGYNGLLAKEEIGTPVRWFQTTGASISLFAADRKGGPIAERDRFAEDLTCLLFPLDGLNVGVLALFKLRAQDRWFDDVIDNMRVER